MDDIVFRILYRERWRARRSTVPIELQKLPKAIGKLLGRASVMTGRILGRAAAKRAVKRGDKPLPRARPWWKLRGARFAEDDPEWWVEELEAELEESQHD